MQQQLNISLSIPIPEGSILISKIELEQLQKESLAGTFWTMKDLEERTGRKREWLEQNILYRPPFQKELAGFVYYPKRGQKWSFQATKMAEFLDTNFHRIFKERSN